MSQSTVIAEVHIEALEKTIRKQFIWPELIEQMAQELANGNTDGNVSELVRKMIFEAHSKYAALGLEPPVKSKKQVQPGALRPKAESLASRFASCIG